MKNYPNDKAPGVFIYEGEWQRPRKQIENFGISSYSQARSFAVPAPPPPGPSTAEILVIGNPYFSLGIPDPTAVESNPTQDIYGVQTVIYSPNVATSGPAVPGFIVKGGGRISRQETVGTNTDEPYVDVRVYDLDGNFIRKNSFEGFNPYVYLYTYEAQRQALRLGDDRILSYLDSSTNCDFGVCDLDGTNASTLAFSGDLEIVYDMALGAISNSVYISDTVTYPDGAELYKLNSDLSPAWAYAYGYGATISFLYTPYLCSMDISGVEVNFLGGCLGDNNEPVYNKSIRLAIMQINTTGTVTNAWKYENTSPWVNDVYNIDPWVFEDFCITGITKDPINGSLLVTGLSACPAVNPLQDNENQSSFIARIDPSTGAVLSAKVIGFKVDWYYGISSWYNHTIAVDDEGYIYTSFTPYFSPETGLTPDNPDTALCIVCRFDSSLNFLGAITVTTQLDYGGLVSGALEIAGDKLLVPLFVDLGAWATTYSNQPEDGAVVVIDKSDIGNINVVGDYWKEGVPAGPGFYIRRLTTTDVEMVDLTLTKTDFTVTQTSRSFASTTPTITTSVKDPTQVTLTKGA